MNDKISAWFNQGVTSSLQANAARERGAVEQAQKLDREALTAFDQVIRECLADLRKSPFYHGAIAGKGMSLAALGETRAAADLLKEACQLVPDFHEYQRQLGLCYIELGEISAARDVTLRAVKLANDPEYTASAAVDVYNFAGNIMRIAAGHRDSGRVAEERKAYEAARDVWSLSMELYPADHTGKALEFVNSLLRTS